jgi:tetratricopeptide (TPR) repeat protein
MRTEANSQGKDRPPLDDLRIASMSKRQAGTFALALFFAIALFSCSQRTPQVNWTTRDEIPPEQLSRVMDAHFRGLGAMERYEYARAAEAFREVHRLAPGWLAGTINLAIALLNQGGEADAKEKGQGKAPVEDGPAAITNSNIDESIRLLDQVLTRQPDNPWAHFSKGIILQDQSKTQEAHLDFAKVIEVDPYDANAWLELGSTMTDPDGKKVLPGSRLLPELISCYAKAVELNPYLTTAIYKLSMAHGYNGDRILQKQLLDKDRKLDPKKSPDGPGERAVLAYGEMGRYARVIDPFPRPKAPEKVAPTPRFDSLNEILVALPTGHRWAKESDFTGSLEVIGRVRARFGQGVAVFDFDRDGLPDVYLTSAVVGPKGVRDVLLKNLGDNKFDATETFGLPDDRAGLGVAAGDFDGDRRVDLFLTGVGDNRLYRNAGLHFEDVTKQAGIDGSGSISLTARWLDLDQDGDLDLYVINHNPSIWREFAFTGKDALPGQANAAYRNDGKPAEVLPRPEDNWAPLAMAPPDLLATKGLSIAFSTAFPGLEALKAGVKAHTAVAALDLDDDRDIDLVVSVDGIALMAILNDRAGAFHAELLEGLKPDAPISGLLVLDLDKDGRPDLVAVGPRGRVSAWRNASTREGSVAKLAWESMPIDAREWLTAQAIDLDLDTWPDLVGLPTGQSPGPAWSRNSGVRFETQLIPLTPDGSEQSPLVGFAMADLSGDALPDALAIRDGLAPRIARNLGNGNHWLAVDLAGRWKTSFDHMRTNSQGLGARLTLEGQGINVPYDHTTPTAGLAQSVGPVVLGMGSSTSAPLLRVRWPDGVMQCELNVTADKKMTLSELSRKTGSCPVLFTWNGTKFECLGDFLGGGGLGYLISPGVYGQPDRDESVAIAPNRLKAVGGVYRLSIVEPMDEVAYLDKLTLDVIDHPPGVSSTPDERFAPEGPRPTGETIAWSKTVEPVRALDHTGRDVTPEIRAWDRRTVDQFRLSQGWIGYAEDHSLILDFGDRLSDLAPDQKLVLCLAGWVEYPYSQTNYAASTAGVALKPPVLERQRLDGSWDVIDPHPGYPAGLPRMMTVDLTGKVSGSHCVLRLNSNMECYYDQAFIALPDPSSRVRTTSLPVARAELRDRGYLREVSPDGRLPLLYEYDYVDPAPLARMEGFLTRHGDVRRLLTTDDDQLCTVGPGDEARLEFGAKGLPNLPEGWTRSYVLRAVGYCKDADPFTAGSDSVGPLPWKDMPAYPFEAKVERPFDPRYSAYLREYQTRPAGVR